MVEQILDLSILEGNHTGQNLANVFMQVVKDFQLQDKILAITTDNASNCDTFFGELNLLLQEQVHTYYN